MARSHRSNVLLVLTVVPTVLLLLSGFFRLWGCAGLRVAMASVVLSSLRSDLDRLLNYRETAAVCSEAAQATPATRLLSSTAPHRPATAPQASLGSRARVSLLCCLEPPLYSVLHGLLFILRS